MQEKVNEASYMKLADQPICQSSVEIRPHTTAFVNQLTTR